MAEKKPKKKAVKKKTSETVIQFPALAKKKQTPRTPKKVSWRKKLEASEERNIVLAKTVEAFNVTLREALVYAAECHEQLSLILIPGCEPALKALSQICMHLAPLCQDVENIRLPDTAIAELMAQGASMVQIPEEEEEASDGDED